MVLHSEVCRRCSSGIEVQLAALSRLLQRPADRHGQVGGSSPHIASPICRDSPTGWTCGVVTLALVARVHGAFC